jgi:putative tricarboxylic transport membrane protein
LLSLTEEFIEIKKDNLSPKFKPNEIFPSLKEIIFCLPTMLRSTVVGFFVGVLPGAGKSIASMLSYKMEQQVASDRKNFGQGSIQGVAAPETADNACSSGSFVPMLSLGIPGSGNTALLLSALVMVGIQPGPGLFSREPELVWGVIASMYIGNIMLVIMCFLLIPVFVWLLRISQKTLPIIVAVLCVAGVYGSQNSLFDVVLMLFFAVIGLFFKLLNIPLAPMLIAIILGMELEKTFMGTVNLFDGDLSRYFARPISLVLFALCVILLALPVVRFIKDRKKRKESPAV